MAGSTGVAPPTDTQFIANGSVGWRNLRLQKTSLKALAKGVDGDRFDSRLRMKKIRHRIPRGWGGEIAPRCTAREAGSGEALSIEGILWFAAGPQIAKNTNILLSKDPVK